MKNKLVQKLLLLAFTALITFGCKKNSPDKPGNNTDNIPVANFEWTGKQLVNSDINFVNKSLNADSYKWDFGNGQTSTKANPGNIKYLAEGTYNVLLTATKGTRKTFSRQVIYITADDTPTPFFTFEFKDKSSTAPATVMFRNQSVNVKAFQWKIDGQTYIEMNPVHTFTKPGKYQVILTALNNNYDAAYGNTVVIDEDNNPRASFALAYHPYPYTVNKAVQLVNTSKNADAWVWTFGNNGSAPSIEEHPEVKFTAAGNYTITLVAKKGTKSSAPNSITLKINP